MRAIRCGTTSLTAKGLVTGAAVLWTVVACGGGASPEASSTASSPSEAMSSASGKPAYASKSYDLGNSVVYRQAFQQFTGTGTPWDKACGSVVDEWQSSVGAESWWNRDDVMRGCLDRDSAAVGAPTAKDCAPQDGKKIRIYSGDISCANAYVITGRYDFNAGPKYQQIDSVDAWTCYTSIADLRPMILSCVSDKNSEFDVSTTS